LRRLVALLPALLVLGACGSSHSSPPDLVFVSSRDGDYALFGVGGDGRHEHRLAKEQGDPSSPAGLFFETEPAWSPDGRLIAFASRRDGHSHIYAMRADGTGVRRVTNTGMDDGHPTWSPDGRRIAFAREGALFVVPATGGPGRRLGRGFGEAAGPAWSPDGRLVAYDYRRPGFSIREIWLVGADGRHPRQLTRLREVSTLPSWSPDGHRIAFQSDVRGGHVEIYSVGRDGHGLRRETRSSVDTFQPAWSPNGREIAFSRDGAIWAVDRSGSVGRISSGQNDSSPAWRPPSR
jgi:TolB protein